MPEYAVNDESLKEVWMIANTPTFLFNQFRRNTTVLNLSRAQTADQLAAAAAELGRARPATVDDLVGIYAYIVAISFKAHSEAQKALTKRIAPDLRWAKELTNLALAYSSATTQQSVLFRAIPSTAQPPHGSSITSSETVAKSSIQSVRRNIEAGDND